ncbi:ABC transporter ATP-binding protein [Nocardia sp. NPDC088792]|uniref:ABC transporter ATP-binding protein n=1 Tax=Nocardia sp. NPDC088792 TaxID=3364332 RepID=UPI003808D95C
MTKDKTNTSWLRRLFGYALRFPGDLLVGFGAALAATAVSVAVPLVSRLVIDDAITAHRRALAPWIFVLLAAAVAVYVLTYLRRYQGVRFAHAVQHELRMDVFRAMLLMDGPQQDRASTGRLIGRLGSDLQLVQSMLYMLAPVTANALMLLLSLTVMCSLSPVLTLVALLVLPALWFIAQRSRRRMLPATQYAQEQTAAVTEVVDAAVSGVQVVKGFGQDRQEQAKLLAVSRRLYRAQLRVVGLDARYSPALRSLPALGQVAMVGLGGWMAAQGHITLGTFVAFSTYLAQLSWPARNVAGMVTTVQRARAGAARIFELIDSRPAVVDGAVPLRPDAPATIEFDCVGFGYDPQRPVFRELALRVDPGETLAVVGAPGSGKSTLALLATRCYDTLGGAVRVGGRDVRELTLDSLRANIGVVPEETFLFSGTIADNIAYGRPDATPERIHAAARAAHADEFIAQLPEGYSTPVGARGLTLSGGQRQRIALARALLTEPRLLILDDPTSAVDATVAADIHGALQEITAHRTTLLIARRRSTLALADRIAVLDDGRIVDLGTAEELEERCGIYRELLTPLDEAEPPPVAPGPTHTAGSNLTTSEPLLSQGFGPSPDKSHGTDLSELIRGFRGPLALSLGLIALDTGAGLLLPLLIRHGIDSGVRRHMLPELWIATLAGLGTVIVQWTAQVGAARLTGRTGERVLFTLRSLIFTRTQRFGLDAYENDAGGRIITAITTDVDAIVSFLRTGLTTALISAVTFVGIFGMLLVIDAGLALPVLATLPLLAVATWRFRRASAGTYRQARERMGNVTVTLREHSAGLRIVQLFRAEHGGAQQFFTHSNDYLTARVRGQRLMALYFPFVQLLCSVAQALVLVIGGHRVQAGTLSVGALVAYLLYIELFFAPVDQLSQVFDTYQQARVSSGRIRELLAAPSATPAAAAPRPVAALRGEIRFEAVQFHYRSRAAHALACIDLTIPAGQTVVFVGATGAGKSTLVKLVARFYDPTAGTVRVDGHDLRDLDLDAYRHRLGIVPQEPYLFAGTVRDAIAYGRMNATDTDIEHAARAVGAHTMITAFEGGYHHVLTAGGRNLSTGQRQLLSLARAQLVNPDILLLDEATSALDHTTENRIRQAITALARRRTTLIVAHRLTTAPHADRIIVLDRGHIIEDGTHHTLLTHQGPYATLWNAYSANTLCVAVPGFGKEGGTFPRA